MAGGVLTPASGGRFPALRHAPFRRYALGQGVSLIGFWMQTVAQGWLVYRLSGSEVALGLVSFAGYLPVLLLAPVAGVVADRVAKQRLILLTQSTAMVLALGVGTLVALDLVTVPIVAAAAACLGVVGAFDLPTRQAFIVEMVGGDDLPSAIAFNASLFNTARVVGPALAGTLVGTIGEAPCFFVNGLSYLAVLWAIGGMPARRVAGAPSERRDLAEGLRYVRSQPVLAALLLALGLVSGLGLQANMLMPAFAQRTFGRGPTGYGLLLTAYGVGAVLSALGLAAGRFTRAQHHRHLLFGLGVFGIGLLGVAASPTFEIALACQTIAGLGMIRYTATTNTVIQVLVENRFRGRVMGLHTVMFMGMAPIGSLILGGVAQPWGPRMALLVAAAAPLAALVLLAPRLARAPDFHREAGSGSQN